MGDQHRSTFLYLLLKDRHDTPARAQYVAKAHGGKKRTVLPFGTPDKQLSHPLGRPHDVYRVDGLVGGDEYEPFRIMLDCQPCQVACTKDVVLDRLRGVKLHQGDLFQGRTVEDNLGPVTLEDGLETV